MKLILLILFLASAASAFQSAEIVFTKNEMIHIFKIKKDKKVSSVTFMENGKPAKTVSVSEAAAADLIAEANRIQWKSAYRKPASLKNCNEYAKIKIGSGPSKTVCQQDGQAAGHAFGFLNKLSGAF